MVGVVGPLFELFEVRSLHLDATIRVDIDCLLLGLFELIRLLLFQIIISVISLHVGR